MTGHGGKDSGGVGGRQRRIQTNVPRGKTSHGGGGGGAHKKGCCPMVAAGRAARKGNFRLARRYGAMTVRVLARRVAW